MLGGRASDDEACIFRSWGRVRDGVVGRTVWGEPWVLEMAGGGGNLLQGDSSDGDPQETLQTPHHLLTPGIPEAPRRPKESPGFFPYGRTPDQTSGLIIVCSGGRRPTEGDGA